jgi:hypothetical protein
MVKVKRWEKIAMTLGALITVLVLWYFKTSYDRALSRHMEVMGLVAGNNVSRLQTADAFKKLLRTIDRDNKAVLALLSQDEKDQKDSITYLRAHWCKDDKNKLVELLPMLQNKSTISEVVGLLQDKTGAKLGSDIGRWQTWLWQQAAPVDTSSYTDFKALLYLQVDPYFLKYFDGHPKALVRLDEIECTGVSKDRVPELCNPLVCPAKEADFLKDNDTVFGFSDKLAARCYAKRIVVWHQIVEDIVGEHNITVAYCPISGLTSIYDNIPDQTYQFTNSGFMYRSNQLMQDHNTSSLWSTMDGSALVGKGAANRLRVAPLPMVITTWGEWRRRHPETTVLGSNTGVVRDYGGPDCFGTYMSNDKLLFPLIAEDRRLANKDPILAPYFGLAGGGVPLAISAAFLITIRYIRALTVQGISSF